MEPTAALNRSPGNDIYAQKYADDHRRWRRWDKISHCLIVFLALAALGLVIYIFIADTRIARNEEMMARAFNGHVNYVSDNNTHNPRSDGDTNGLNIYLSVDILDRCFKPIPDVIEKAMQEHGVLSCNPTQCIPRPCIPQPSIATECTAQPCIPVDCTAQPCIATNCIAQPCTPVDCIAVDSIAVPCTTQTCNPVPCSLTSPLVYGLINEMYNTSRYGECPDVTLTVQNIDETYYIVPADYFAICPGFNGQLYVDSAYSRSYNILCSTTVTAGSIGWVPAETVNDCMQQCSIAGIDVCGAATFFLNNNTCLLSNSDAANNVQVLPHRPYLEGEAYYTQNSTYVFTALAQDNPN